MGRGHAAKNRTIEEELREKGLFPNTSAPWQQEILTFLLSQGNFPNDPICLDAACGIGNNVETLLAHFQKVIGFDKSSKAIDFARERYKKEEIKVSFSMGDLESIPYSDNFFDCVVCTEALEHVPDSDKVLKEIFRVTKYGGYVVLSFQNHFNFATFLKFLFEKIYKKNWDVWGTHGHEEGYENYLTCFRVKRLINKSGFISKKEMGADYINAWLSWIPFLYRNYKILDHYPLFGLGGIPLLKYMGMDYFMLLKKP